MMVTVQARIVSVSQAFVEIEVTSAGEEWEYASDSPRAKLWVSQELVPRVQSFVGRTAVVHVGTAEENAAYMSLIFLS